MICDSGDASCVRRRGKDGAAMAGSSRPNSRHRRYGSGLREADARQCPRGVIPYDWPIGANKLAPRSKSWNTRTTGDQHNPIGPSYVIVARGRPSKALLLQYCYEPSTQVRLRDLPHHPGHRRICESGCSPLNALDEDSKRYGRLGGRGFATRSSSRRNCVLESHLRGYRNPVSAWQRCLCYRRHSRRGHSIARQPGPPSYSLVNDAREPGKSTRGLADHPI
jgi:hypothetical protein